MSPLEPVWATFGLGERELGRHAGPCGLCTLRVGICGEVGHSALGLLRRQPALPGDLLDLVVMLYGQSGHVFPYCPTLFR